EVVMLVLRSEFAETRDGRIATVRGDHDIRADLERLLAVADTAHADDAAVLFDQLRDLRAHPAAERRKRLRLSEQRREKDRLRHPDGVGVLRDDPLERELPDLSTPHPSLVL